MNSTDNQQACGANLDCATPETCFVCGDQTGALCFCKIHLKRAVPVMLCCPSCTIQYIDSTPTPGERLQPELRDGEKGVRLFVGEEKPWS